MADLKREEDKDGYIFTGTREQLIAAGIVSEWQFPGEPGKGEGWRRGKGWADFDEHPGCLTSVRRVGKNRFYAYVQYTEAEKRSFDQRIKAAEHMVLRRTLPLIEHMNARYWGISWSGGVHTIYGNIPEQWIQCEAPLKELQRRGLVTQKMLDAFERNRGVFHHAYCEGEFADRFCLTDLSQDRPGYWRLALFTQAEKILERKRLDTRDARRELTRIFGCRVRAAA